MTSTFRLPPLLICLLATPGAAQEPAPVRIILETSPRAVEYQLGRLSNAELSRVERKPGDPRYRPIYVAMLTRKGLGREYFDEALTALAALDKASRTAVLMEGLSRVAPDDDEAAGRLVRALLTQPADALALERERFASTAASTASGPALRGAYGGLLSVEQNPVAVVEAARGREGHLAELLRAVPFVSPAVSAKLAATVGTVLSQTQDPAVRAAAVTALSVARPDAQTFTLLAREAVESPDPGVRTAAVRGLRALPRVSWPAAEVEPLARSLVAALVKVPPPARTEPASLEAIQFTEQLSEALPDATRRTLRRDLRALGVQVVRIEAIPEQMIFDLKWFAVEAGKPVQIILFNPDAMSHNLVVMRPGTLQEVGAAANAMSISTDPAAKPYVPPGPQVLHATRLLQWGETERLSFTAPAEAGEYPFACTFPGHWVRMYGVMLVVKDLDAWEGARTVPLDPMTKKPMAK